MEFDQQNAPIPKTQLHKYYDTSINYITYLKNRIYINNPKKQSIPLYPSTEYTKYIGSTFELRNNTGNLLCIRYCHTAMSKEKSEILSLSWSPGGRRLISGSKNGQLTLWDGNSFHKEKFLSGSQDGIKCLAWSHNEKWLVVGDVLGDIHFRKPTLDLLFTTKCHDKMIKSISFSPSDNRFLTCSDDSKVKVFINIFLLDMDF